MTNIRPHIGASVAIFLKFKANLPPPNYLTHINPTPTPKNLSIIF